MVPVVNSSVTDPGCSSWIPVQVKKIPGSRIRIRIKEFKYFVFKLSEIWSKKFIPDPDLDFLLIPDPGVKKVPDPDAQH